MENVILKDFFIWILFLSIFEYTKASVSCSFDFGLCGWKTSKTEQFKWVQTSGQTPDRLSGPIQDHTCANFNGQYVYLPGSDSKRGDVAILETDHVNIEDGTFLTFWFIMNGFGSGNLSLNAISDNTSVTLWKKNGRQGKDWVKETVSVTPGLVKLQFKSSVRLPVGSDVAIDDIELSSESQVLNNSHCLKTTTTSTTTTATTTKTTTRKTTTKPLTSKRTTTKIQTTLSPTKDICKTNNKTGVILDGSCDFETDMCGFEVFPDSTDRHVSWVRTNSIDGSSRDKYHSIFYDHTFGNTSQTRGYYMDFKNSRGFIWNTPKNTAHMKTPVIYASELCLSFWYSMPQAYSNLKLLTEDQDGQLTEIFDSMNAPHSDKSGWHFMSLSIEQQPPFKIVFQSYNTHFMARAGIDDVKLVGYNILPHVNTTRVESTTTTTSEPMTSPDQDLTSSTVLPSKKNTTHLITEMSSTTVTSTIIEITSPHKEITSSNASSPKLHSSSVDTVTPISSSALQSTEPNTITTVTSETASPSKLASSIATDAVVTSSGTAELTTISSPTNPLLVTTEKGSKKTTIAATKKPGNDKLGKTNALSSDENKFERISIAVGAGVGAFAGVVFLGLVIYFVAAHRAKQRDAAYRIDSENAKENHRQRNDNSNHNVGNSFIAVNNTGFILESNGKIGKKTYDEMPMEDNILVSQSDKVTYF